MNAQEVLTVLHEAADAVVDAFVNHQDWGKSGQREDQYVADLVADEAILAVLQVTPMRVLSEESGLGPKQSTELSTNELRERGWDGELIAVVDPLDGSTNASLGLDWFATSLCVVDSQGPWVAVVHDHPGNKRYAAIRGQGATLNGAELTTPPAVELSKAVVAVNGAPPLDASWWQFRAMGSCALELCAVADGRFAGYLDFSGSLHVWDYLGALLVCQEVGLTVVDAENRNLTAIDHAALRSPLAAPGALVPELLKVRTEHSRRR